MVLFASGEGSYQFDPETATFAFDYTGTKSLGAGILENVFASLHDPERPRQKVPPIFLFEKASTSKSRRSVRFKGLCIPRTPQKNAGEDLVLALHEEGRKASQKHLAYFTVIDAPKISGQWTASLFRGEERPDLEPVAFRNWKESGVYDPITTPDVWKHWDKDGKLWWELSA